MPLKRWKKISSEMVLNNGFWKYNKDKFELPDGTDGEYHYMHSPGSTMIIPVSAANKLVMVKQYRYLYDTIGWEFPCGSVEEGYSFEQNALKELREESGYTAAELTQVAKFTPYTGASDEICYVFIARDLTPSPLPPDETEEFEVAEFTIPEIEEMVKKNIIQDGQSLAAFVLTRHLLQE